MGAMKSFGEQGRFEIEFGWHDDPDPVGLRPADHGWSMGRFAIHIAGRNLMEHRVGDARQDHTIWYLGPWLHWIADNWTALLHEDHLPWRERGDGGAAELFENESERLGMTSPLLHSDVDRVQEWYFRHGMASAAAGGLFRDIFLRRYGDDAELSWSADSPQFAPEGFVFAGEPGFMRMPVVDVGSAIWNMLSWVAENPPELETAAFQADFDLLCSKIAALQTLDVKMLNRAGFRSRDVFDNVCRVSNSLGIEEAFEPVLAANDNARFIVEEAPAVAMFGGVEVDLSDGDIAVLLGVLKDGNCSTGDGEELALRVVNTPVRNKPWRDGYDLADDFLDTFDGAIEESFVNVELICQRLEIGIERRTLDTDTIRGVALAGKGYSPTILVNMTSRYNANDVGERFTIAHELCHVLHDRGRACRVAHLSGRWATPDVEKRANAFAAWLLAPPQLLSEINTDDATRDRTWLKHWAGRLRVAESALVRHLGNLGLLDDTDRDLLLDEILTQTAAE